MHINTTESLVTNLSFFMGGILVFVIRISYKLFENCVSSSFTYAITKITGYEKQKLNFC